MRRIFSLLILLINFSTEQTAAAEPTVDVPLSYASTGVATAQQQLQLSGRGVAVAILDTGVDYASSGLFGAGCASRPGGAFGRSGTACRIIAARDFVGDVSSLERGSFKPDNDPMDCRSPDGSHGTAVASIAVGDSSANVPKGGKPWRGVAYAASIKAYKIAGSCKAVESGVSRSAAVQAIKQAAADGADVINMSFGPDFRVAAWGDELYVPALTRAVQSGTLVAGACGNDGVFGPFITDNSMVPPHMISVASAQVLGKLPTATMRFTQPVTAAGSNTLSASAGMLFASAMKGEAEAVVRKMTSLKLPLQVVTAQPLLACGSSLSNKAQVRGKLVLIKRGKCTFLSKANAAAAAGAAAVIIYNNETSAVDEPAGSSFTLGMSDAPRIPVWGLDNAAGEALFKAASRSKKGLLLVGLQLSKRQLEIRSVIASSSSSGPPATLELLPTITAPGEDARTTLAGNSFAVESGTSLAAPLVTGSLALLKQARPDLFIQQPGSKLPAGSGGRTNQAAAYNALVATARPLPSVVLESKQAGWAEPVSRAGAGLIQLDAAIRNPTVLRPNFLALRSNTRRQTLTFTATNNGRFVEVSYALGHRPAAAVDIGSASWWKDVPEQLQQPLAARVSFAVAGRAVSEVTIRRGGSVTVQALFELPEDLASKPLLYSGYILLTPKQQPAAAAATVAEQAVAGSARPRVALAAVPLVLPYQGFSRNYTTLPILPTTVSAASELASFRDSAQVLQGQLNVCFADFAETPKAAADDYSSNQDGFYVQQQVDACLYSAAEPAATKKLPLAKLENIEGGLIVAAALLRPAMRMRLMLFDAVPAPCSQSQGAKAKPCSQQQAGAAASNKLTKGALVGEIWRKTDNSRDLPQSLWAYTGPFFGFAEARSASDKLERYVRVLPKRKYKMQLWIEGPVAAADRAAGEKPHTFKHNVPGVFEFV